MANEGDQNNFGGENEEEGKREEKTIGRIINQDATSSGAIVKETSVSDDEIICLSESETGDSLGTLQDSGSNVKNSCDHDKTKPARIKESDETKNEDEEDDILVEREIRLDPSGQVIVSEGAERLVCAERDSLNNHAGERSSSRPSRSRSRSRSSVSTSWPKRPRSRSNRSKSNSQKRDEEEHINSSNQDNFIVLDCTSDDGSVGDTQDGNDDSDVEVIRSNLELAERERSRRRSRSKQRNSRRRSSSRERSRSRSHYNRECRHEDDRWPREPRRRERWEDSRWRRKNRDEERRDREWRDKSGAFLARLGVRVDEKDKGSSYLDSLNLPSLDQLANLNYLNPHQPPTFSRQPSFHPSDSTPHVQASPPIPGGSASQSWSSREAERPRQGQDLDFRHTEVLRPGNYLLVTWDILPLGSGLKSSIYQIGAHTAHGDSMVTCVLPATPGQRAEATLHPTCPLVKVTLGGKVQLSVRHPSTGRYFECVGEREALQQMIDFLEKGRNRVRPAYDGVVLLSHLPEIIPQLLKSLQRWGLYNQFQRSVASLGDLSTFLSTTVHHQRLKENGQLNVSLEFAYERLTKGLKAKLSSSLCDRPAALIMELLERLLETQANHANFFSSYSNPLLSKKVTEWKEQLTVREKQELFKPLERYIAQELAVQQVDLITSGFLGDAEENRGEPEKRVAGAMVRLLVSAGFDFSHMLATAANNLEQLELELRTTLLGKMAGQGRAVVDQTVRATRLVVAFFKLHGACSLEELQTESRQLDALEEEVAMELSSGHSEEQKEKNSTEMAEMVRFLTRRRGEEVDVVDGAVRCLLEAGLSVPLLQRFHKMELAEGEAWACRAMRRHLLRILNPLRTRSGVYVDLHTLVAAVMDYMDTKQLSVKNTSKSATEESTRGAPSWYQCSLCQKHGAHWLVDCPTAEGKFKGVDPADMEESYLKDTLAKLEAASRQGVFVSLQAIQRSIYQKIVGEVVEFGGRSEQAAMIADIVHRVISMLRTSHFSMKNEFDSIKKSFRNKLRARLVGLPCSLLSLLPHGVDLDTLVNWVTEYFQDFSIHGGMKKTN